jgi:hypothetical protein
MDRKRSFASRKIALFCPVGFPTLITFGSVGYGYKKDVPATQIRKSCRLFVKEGIPPAQTKTRRGFAIGLPNVNLACLQGRWSYSSARRVGPPAAGVDADRNMPKGLSFAFRALDWRAPLDHGRH